MSTIKAENKTDVMHDRKNPYPIKVTKSHGAMLQVIFQAPAELWIWHTVFYSLPAWLGSAHYSPIYHFCLFIHIPVSDPVPPHVLCFQYLFGYMFSIPDPHSKPKPWSPFCSTLHHIPLVLFLFPLLFLTLCSFPMTLICSLWYLYVQNFMYVSSVWNQHRLSLLNSSPSIPNLLNHPNLWGQ